MLPLAPFAVVAGVARPGRAIDGIRRRVRDWIGRVLVRGASVTIRSARSPAVAVALALGFATLTLSAPAPAADSGTWLPPEILATGDIDPASVDLNFARSSGAAAWRVNDGGVWRVRVAQRLGNRVWGAAETVSAPGVATDSPHVEIINAYNEFEEQSGQAVVAMWRAFDGAHWRIQVSARLTQGGTWSDPAMMSAAGQNAENLETGSFYDYGGTHRAEAFWRRFDGAHWRVQTNAVIGFTGDPGTATDISTAGHDVRDLSYDGRLAWSLYDGSNWRAQAVYRDNRSGSFDAPETLSPVGEDALTPRATFDDVVWRSFDGTNWRVRLRHRGTSHWWAPVYLSPAGLDADPPRVATCSRAVVWRQHDGSNWRAAGRVYLDSWTPLTYLSSAGHDSSAPEMAGCGSVPAWTEPVGGHVAARAAAWTSSGSPMVATLSHSDAEVGGVVARDTKVAWVDAAAPTNVLQVAILDNTGPYAGQRIKAVQGDEPSPLHWWARDDWSKVADFDIRQMVARFDRDGWTRNNLLSHTTDRSWSGPFRPGRTYCFRVRARDTVGNLGPWSDYQSCTVTPFDDRRLERSGAWKALNGPRYFQHTYLTTRQKGASLVAANLRGVRRIGMLVATGPGNGRIRVTYPGFYAPVVINLDTPSQDWLVIRGMIAWGPYGTPGTLKITVVSRGKPVRVDGVYAGRR